MKMNSKIHSFDDLKGALQQSALKKAVELSENGKHFEAIEHFDKIKEFSVLDTRVKACAKSSYCITGKVAQSEGKFMEAFRVFSRAKTVAPADSLLLERTKLLASRTEYRNSWNIGEFRKFFGLGFTSGGYEKSSWPFRKIAEEKGIIQEPKYPGQSSLIREIKSIGVYRIQAQGRHLLSQKIREYKRGNSELALPFAWLMADVVLSLTKFVTYIDVIIPSPSNPNKYLDRGFVPPLLIAEALSKCLAIPYRDLFSVAPLDCRFRDLPYDEAKSFVRFKHQQAKAIYHGTNVLLLDDVFTSGRTLTILADILITAGANDIYGITLAKTGPASS